MNNIIDFKPKIKEAKISPPHLRTLVFEYYRAYASSLDEAEKLTDQWALHFEDNARNTL